MKLTFVALPPNPPIATWCIVECDDEEVVAHMVAHGAHDMRHLNLSLNLDDPAAVAALKTVANQAAERAT